MREKPDSHCTLSKKGPMLLGALALDSAELRYVGPLGSKWVAQVGDAHLA